MGIEKILDSISFSGRKTISYLLTDPFGESCLIAGSYMANHNGPAEITYPLLLTGLYHTTRITLNRIKLDRLIEKHGWNKKIIEKFSKTSWCSNMMLRAYSWGSKKFDEFENIIKRYGTQYHLELGLKKLRSLF